MRLTNNYHQQPYGLQNNPVEFPNRIEIGR